MSRPLAFQKMHDYLLANPPYMKDGVTRRTGSMLWSCFWRGFDGIKPCTIGPGNAVYAAWKAGKAYQRKQGVKDSNK